MKLLENSNTALRNELELFRKTSLNKKVNNILYWLFDEFKEYLIILQDYSGLEY